MIQQFDGRGVRVVFLVGGGKNILNTVGKPPAREAGFFLFKGGKVPQVLLEEAGEEKSKTGKIKVEQFPELD